MVVGFQSETAWQSTPKRSKTIAAQRLSSTLKGVLLRSAPRRGRKTAVIQWRAEPANTPLVEQARLWHLCLRGGFWWERNSDLLASENEQRRPTRKAEVFERLLPPRERKLRGCGKLVWVDAAVDWNQPAKRGASTNAEFLKPSGIHAAKEVGS